jgi:hypothetical protein
VIYRAILADTSHPPRSTRDTPLDVMKGRVSAPREDQAQGLGFLTTIDDKGGP